MPRSAERHPDDPSNERAKARSFHHSSYSAARIADERLRSGLSASVCLPARECARTVSSIVGALLELREAGAIDEVVVIDAASADGTAAVAERAGALVWQESDLLPSYGPVRGKGDAMWRALPALRGELVCFLDADTEHFSPHFAIGLLGPLVCESGFSFVKAFYRRPFVRHADPGSDDGASAGAPGAAPDDGGRVNHLTARPALALFYPQLAHVRQPLAGEVAARRDLLEQLPFVTGYGVEIGMLIDAWREVGSAGIAQVDLDEHHNHHQPLSALAPMALTVLATIARRLEQEGSLRRPGTPIAGMGESARDHAPVERPPWAHMQRAGRVASGGRGPA